MACGTVPVCYANKEYTYYVRPDENAIAIRLDRSWKDYATAVEGLIQDRKKLKRLSEQAATIAKNFTWDTFVSNQLEVYKKLCQERS